MELTILFVLSIFMTIWFGTIILAKLIRGNEILQIHFLIFSMSLTALITHTISIW